ncbi:hypothetical protein Trydic_g16895 [Trypoxylus dichotomus]
MYKVVLCFALFALASAAPKAKPGIFGETLVSTPVVTPLASVGSVAPITSVASVAPITTVTRVAPVTGVTGSLTPVAPITSVATPLTSIQTVASPLTSLTPLTQPITSVSGPINEVVLGMFIVEGDDELMFLDLRQHERLQP